MDEHFRPKTIEIAGQGFLVAIGLGLLVTIIITAASTWADAPVAVRVILIGAIVIIATFTLIVGAYQYYDLAELRDRHRFNRERRLKWLEEVEEETPELPRPILVRGAVAGGNGNGKGEDPTLSRLLELVDVIGQVGLSWRKVGPLLGWDRELWDYALRSDPNSPGVLVALGLVEGRRPGAEGRLVHDVETTKRLLRTVWAEATG